eukprot:381011-Alexandrium_andersonii.AAC.1
MEGRAAEWQQRPAQCASPCGSGRASETAAGPGDGSAPQSQPYDGALGGTRVHRRVPEVYQGPYSEAGRGHEALGGVPSAVRGDSEGSRRREHRKGR